MKISEFMSYVIPVLSIFISYILGRYQSSRKYKNEQAEKVYNSLYSPFLTFFFKHELHRNLFTGLDIAIQNELFNLITDNLMYMDSESIESARGIIRNYHNVLNIDNGKDIGIPESMTKYGLINQAMHEFIPSMLSKSIKLSKELYLPPVGESALTLWNESQS